MGRFAHPVFATLLFLGLTFGCHSSLAALDSEIRPQISANLVVSADALSGHYTLNVDFAIPRGMHQFRQDQFFYIRLAKDIPGLSAGLVVYPPSTETIIGLPAWSNTVRLQLPLIITAPSSGQLPNTIDVLAAWQICYDSGICLRPEKTQFAVNLPTANLPTNPGGVSLAWYLLLAFLGGLILNLMPCVLPVLALKTMSLIKQTEGGYSQRVLSALANVAGILVSMLVLAGLIVSLQAGGRAAGWGFQFQSPLYTVTLSVIVLSFALSLWGVWTIRAPTLKATVVPGKKSGRAGALIGSFLNGVLMVVLATPCTAPFLGTALGFAFAAPPLDIFLILFACGVGLALPFFLLALVPQANKFLPKPGKWMEKLSEIMGFALLGTFIWLMTVVLHQLSLNSFIVFLWLVLLWTIVLRCVGWLQQSSMGNPWRMALYGVILLSAVAIGVGLVQATAKPDNPSQGTDSSRIEATAWPAPWQNFNPTAIDSDLAQGHAVFVDFTAEWCLTCKLNEAGPLSDPGVLRAFQKTGVRLYRGDYTNGNPTIDNWLSLYGRAGVPFYLFLRPDGSHQVLPELLTSELLNHLASP